MAKWNGRQDISLPIQTCRRHYLVGITGSDRSCDGLFSPFPLFASNGGVPRVSAGSAPTSIVRGLLDVHSRYPPEADLIAGPTRGPLFRRLRRSSIAAPIASGRSEPGAWGSGYPWSPKTLARRTRTPVLPDAVSSTALDGRARNAPRRLSWAHARRAYLGQNEGDHS